MCKYCRGEDLPTNEYYLKEMEIAEDIDRKTDLILYFCENIEDVEERVKNLLLEIERLNNIINELEKWLEDYHNNTGLGEYETGIDDGICDTLKKLQELKGDSSNE